MRDRLEDHESRLRQRDRDFAGAKIRIGDDGSYSQQRADGSNQKLEKASITLEDCLACSGCVTSAETVLIEQQSGEQLER